MPFLSDRQLDRMYASVLSGRIIPYLAGVLLVITMGAALLVRLLARGEFKTYGESLWWAAQTVTTVGYGDVIPHNPFSKAIAVAVMLLGIATVSLTTAVITSAVSTAAQRRQLELRGGPELTALATIADRLEVLATIEQRLDAIERRLSSG
jgi:voltage-gated potassium channel